MPNTLPRLSDLLKVTEHQGMGLGFEPRILTTRLWAVKTRSHHSLCLPTLYYYPKTSYKEDLSGVSGS